MRFKLGEAVRINKKSEPYFHNKIGRIVDIDDDIYDETPYIVFLSSLNEDFCFAAHELDCLNSRWNEEVL